MSERFYSINFVCTDEKDTSSIEYQRCALPSYILGAAQKRYATETLSEGDPSFDINVYQAFTLTEERKNEIKNLHEKGSSIALDVTSMADSSSFDDIVHFIDIFIGDDFCDYRNHNFHRVKTPLTFTRRTPREHKGIRSGDKVNLYWFGMQEEKRSLKHIKKNQVDYHGNYLYTCTGKAYNTPYSIPWETLKSPQERLDEMDCILLPKGTSPWRVLDALMSGVFVIMDEREKSFKPFKNYGYFGNMNDGITFYKENPSEAVDRSIKGQEWVVNNYRDVDVFMGWQKGLLLE